MEISAAPPAKKTVEILGRCIAPAAYFWQVSVLPAALNEQASSA